MTHPRPLAIRSASYFFLVLLTLPLTVKAASAADSTFTLLSGLSSYQVFQRGATDTVSFRVGGGASHAGEVKLSITAEGAAVGVYQSAVIGSATGGSWSGLVKDLPVGGPYTFAFQLTDAQGQVVSETKADRVLVGDLWMLAGQSNMVGYGKLKNVEEPSDRVNMFRMRHMWDEAKEPIHRLWESVDRFHRSGTGEEKPMPSMEESEAIRAARYVGAGLSLPFAKQMVARTGVPIGLVPTAHGGTSMDQWSPDLRGMGGDSLYGSFLGTLAAVGGKVRGVLWYQAESDTSTEETVATFTGKFTRLVDAMRQDAGDPSLPFYYVQIGCWARLDAGTALRWNAIREQQRLCETKITNSGLAASIDLELDDGIHIGVEGNKRLGKRMANLALGAPSRGPRFSRIERGAGHLRVVFEGGSGKLHTSKGRISGFSIRNATGEESAPLFKQEVDPEQPNTVLLWPGAEIPEGSQLWYGFGLMPFCNLTDSEDMAVLAMGPIPIPAP